MKSFVLMSFFLLCSFLSADTIHVGYEASSLNALTRKDLTIASDIWLKEMAREINYETQSHVYDDPAQMVQDLADNKLDYVAASGLVFVKYFDLSKLEDGFASGFFNGEKETFVILVQKESGIKSVEDLRNKTIALQKDDTIVSFYLEERFSKNNTSQNLLLEEFPTRQRALLKLFFNNVQAAVITNKSYELAKELNPQIGEKIKILEATNIEATNFGFLRKNLNENTKKILRSVSKNVHTSERGRTLLTLYKTEIITDSKLKDLKPFEELYKKNQATNKEK